MTKKSLKVIFDTNVWISFLIGKQISSLKKYIVEGDIEIITTDKLLIEIETVTSRDKLRRYFSKDDVEKLLQLINVIGTKFDIKPTHTLSRDPKDSFLLDLIEFSKADFLVTGDKDLLENNPFKTARILTPSDFENFLKYEF